MVKVSENFLNQITVLAKDGYDAVNINNADLINSNSLSLNPNTSNPIGVLSNKAVLWYRSSDGYVVISDSIKDIVLNGTGIGDSSTLSEVLTSGNDANDLNIINLNSLYALDGYFTNSVTIGGKLTVGGLIDPTGLVLESQGSNPTTPEAGKATLWYRSSDGYVVISDSIKDIVLNDTGIGDSSTLSEVLTSGNDANDLNIINLNSLYALDGYFTNSVSIGGKLTVGGLIDPTGLVLESQTTVPVGAPVSGNYTLWVKSSDGYAILTDSSGIDTVISGGVVKTEVSAETDGYEGIDGYYYDLTVLQAGHTSGMYYIGSLVEVEIAASSGYIVAKAVIGSNQVSLWAPQNVTTTGYIFFPTYTIYSDGLSDIKLNYTWSNLTGTPLFKLKGSIMG
jgi:hypothetical protein